MVIFCYRSESNSFVANMESILGVRMLPTRADAAGDGNEGNECGICYAVDSPEELNSGSGATYWPDQICVNDRCAKKYHKSCLVGWLQSIPSSRTSFGTIFGVCPYCSESISVKAFS